jgi:hypothetical protein
VDARGNGSDQGLRAGGAERVRSAPAGRWSGRRLHGARRGAGSALGIGADHRERPGRVLARLGPQGLALRASPRAIAITASVPDAVAPRGGEGRSVRRISVLRKRARALLVLLGLLLLALELPVAALLALAQEAVGRSEASRVAPRPERVGLHLPPQPRLREARSSQRLPAPASQRRASSRIRT